MLKVTQHVVRFFYRPPLSRCLIALWLPVYFLSLLYGCFMCLRGWAYSCGLLKSVEPCLPAISIGNLTVGGAGKTPITMFVAERLRAAGRKPVIISRGYKGEYEGRIALVSDGTKTLLSAQKAGDEPVMMAKSLVGVPVIIGAKRPEAIDYAGSKTDADVAVCDDAFQHLRLRRQLNFLCISGDAGFGNHQTLPLGPLREPLSALKRASLIFINDSLGVREDIDGIAYGVGFDGSIIHWHYQVEGFRDLRDGKMIEARELQGSDIHAFAATAQPESFFGMLKRAGYRIVATSQKGDHENWRESEMSSWPKASFHVCTEKDFVKLPERLSKFDGRIVACVVRPHLVESDIKIVDDLIKEKL